MKITVNNISFSYKSKQILSDIHFEIKPHEIVSILGPNGAGKTTLLRNINKILKPSSGSIMIDDSDLHSLTPQKIARLTSYVAQKPEASRLTAFDVILMGRLPYVNWNIREIDLMTVQSIIHSLHLESLALRYTDSMSSGEFQKVCIARALVQEPELILLDEPTSSLDLKNRQEILSMIQLVAETHELSVLMTLHDINTALRYSSRLIFLKSGKIYALMTPDEVTPEIIEEVYGVKVEIHNTSGRRFIIPE
jgi:iron complex transport system ATP-binding protein